MYPKAGKHLRQHVLKEFCGILGAGNNENVIQMQDAPYNFAKISPASELCKGGGLTFPATRQWAYLTLRLGADLIPVRGGQCSLVIKM